ncbi:hypothetical protein [Mycobacterium paraintracellulare]|uniref:hypothetical protein n=1 Tax=Mycobacterium paraintracellulare TaxID=1138383 RepID=UPI0019270F21|nr:hypothetical protein [Mycobacterium paraintracellulare]
MAAPPVLPDVPARIEACRRAILGLLSDGDRLTGVQLSHALGRELREHFAPAAAELVAAGLLEFTTNGREHTYAMVTDVAHPPGADQ